MSRYGRASACYFAVAGYRFTSQLLELERNSEGSSSKVLQGAEEVVTPLKWQQWEKDLGEHPDKEWVEFLVRGLRRGFRLGHDQDRSRLGSQTGSMYEASQHRDIITNYLQNELQERRIWRVDGDTVEVQCSPFGVIPKKGKPGRWRLIVNLSAPEGCSVNDGISKDLASVTYTSVDEVAHRVGELGWGALMAKADVKAAYRNVPVHPRDRWLLGMEWEGVKYVDGTLPFGLRSAPLLFTALGDAVQWIVENECAGWIRHYIDDFIVVGSKGTNECQSTMAVFKESCKRLGMPLDDSKEEGPCEVLTFLGIEIDSIKGELRLPQDKVSELRELLAKWGSKKHCRRRELESLVGSLNHACKVVRPGRAFKRRLQSRLAGVRRDGQRVRLNLDARADIEWWRQFGLNWNGTSLLSGWMTVEGDEIELVSDASGSWGCGAFWNGKWFQIKWDEVPGTAEWSIMPKELLPIVVAMVVWGKRWWKGTITARCDNMSVVAAVGAGNCKEKRSMHMLRCLAMVEATLSLAVRVEHIRGVDNRVADALSRNEAEFARMLMQGAEMEPTAVPRKLLEVLCKKGPSWCEPEWEKLLGLL